MATEGEILEARRKRAEQLREAGEALFPARIPEGVEPIPEVIARLGERTADELEADPTSTCVAGRIMAIRSFGNAAFVIAQGEGERLQIWVKKNGVGAERYQAFKLYEVGDFMWGRGPIIRTKSGELTLQAAEIGFLAKSYRPLPEKFHGLVDVEARYRQRYLDLLTNPEARKIAVSRSRMVTAIRRIMKFSVSAPMPAAATLATPTA